MIKPALYGCEGKYIQGIKSILWQERKLFAHVCPLLATELLVSQLMLVGLPQQH
jgi:hypothetical protein